MGDIAKASFGEALRKFRLASGLTQEELARRLSDRGFSATQTMVAKIERGDRPTSIAEAAVIAAYFGTPVQSFLPLDRLSATLSHLSWLETSRHSLDGQIEDIQNQLTDIFIRLSDLHDHWDEYVRDMTESEIEYVKEFDLDPRSTYERGLRERDGEHPEEA
ncbi:helix-turn-helix transcriptional regulator [Arthrobacter sp. D2-10]